MATVAPAVIGRGVDLLRLSVVRRLVVSRWPWLIVRAVALAILLLIIAGGLAGTPVGNRNIGIVLVWIGWWAALVLAAVPLLGRGWCAVCPLPLPGEWLQRGAVLGPSRGRTWLASGRRWPRALRNTWLQTALFLLLALVAMTVLTRPAVTAAVLALLLLLGVAVSVVFERRTFCRHLCPVGGFIGVYSQAAPLAVRVRDTAVCATHHDKTCVTGSADAWGCPWNVYPGALLRNVDCGLCFECVQACPRDNVGLYLQPVGADLAQDRGRRTDEAFKALVLLGSAAAYAAVMLGPWGALKTAALAVGSGPWALFAALFLVTVAAVVPAAFWLAVRLGATPGAPAGSVRHAFRGLAASLVPLGLAAWMAFSLSLLLVNGSYLAAVLSDPFGWGWDLFGTAGTAWLPFLTSFLPWAQAAVLLGGLAWSATVATRWSARHGRPISQVGPVVLFQLLAAVGLLWLNVG